MTTARSASKAHATVSHAYMPKRPMARNDEHRSITAPNRDVNECAKVPVWDLAYRLRKVVAVPFRVAVELGLSKPIAYRHVRKASHATKLARPKPVREALVVHPRQVECQ